MSAPIPESTLQAVGKLARLLWRLVRDEDDPITAERLDEDFVWQTTMVTEREREEALCAAREEEDYGNPLQAYDHPVYLVAGPRQSEEQQHAEPLPKAVRRGLKDGLRCEKATFCLLVLVFRVVTSLDSSANVEWLTVYPRPNFAIIHERNRPFQNIVHSVIRITLGTGKIFILDLTGAQYGHSSARVYAWEKYKKDFVAKPNERTGPRWWVGPPTGITHGLISKWGRYSGAFRLAYSEWIQGFANGADWWRQVSSLSEATLEQHLQRCVDLARDRVKVVQRELAKADAAERSRRASEAERGAELPGDANEGVDERF
ncbi:uncharacterized protein EI97DRAFT_459166 [Westerdykella ornata]|uniref:Uncharacterized protein n=1 Tax=Westerdykella ornata TaxID=318751 RepID=A0A6A6JJ64_WESOR|nr:uncharacterized protein EI97DRAFT_459166 [Westerdykella ornata]KAF2275706.1 hypothetical protein EI97DRAFT_459166 [Westerdykella ornata]